MAHARGRLSLARATRDRRAGGYHGRGSRQLPGCAARIGYARSSGLSGGGIEGAGTKNVSGRGGKARIITDLNQPWGTSDTCTKCGKCVMSCPTGALFNKGSTVGEMERDRTKLEFIVTAREKKQWIAD